MAYKGSALHILPKENYNYIHFWMGAQTWESLTFEFELRFKF